jgi:hypothetical protein
MFEHERIPISLACNDPRNGSFSEELYGLEIGENMHFDCRYGDWGPRLRYLVNDDPGKQLIRAISIAGKHFPVSDYKPWQGNWCWDGFNMEGRYVLELLNWPRLRKWFDVSRGETRLFNWWKAGEPWSDMDLRLIGKRF